MGEESMDDLIKDEVQIRHKIEELIIAGILNFTVVLPGEFSMLAISPARTRLSTTSIFFIIHLLPHYTPQTPNCQ